MKTRAHTGPDAHTITVEVPLTFIRRGGRKQVLSPEGAPAPWAPSPARIDSTLVKAIARAFRWRAMLENEYATLREIAKAEKINESYHRPLSLTDMRPFAHAD